MDRTHRVVLDPDAEEGGFTVTVPALPGVVTGDVGLLTADAPPVLAGAGGP